MSEAHSDAFDLKNLYKEDIDPGPESGANRAKQSLEMNTITPARIMAGDWRALVGGAVLAFFILMDTVGVWLVERPTSGNTLVLAAPFESLTYPLDADAFGQPIHARLIHAILDTSKMVFADTVVSIGFAALVGFIAGFEHSTCVDSSLVTVTDAVIMIPGLPLIIVITAIFQPENFYIIGVFFDIDNWPGLAWTACSQVPSIRGGSRVEMSEIMDIPLSSILRRDILSQFMPCVMINGVLTLQRIIFESVELYFPDTLPFITFSQDVMMNLAYEGNALTHPDMFPWMVVLMVCIFLSPFGLVLLSQGFDSLFNVQFRARHANTSKKGTLKNN